MGLGLFLAALQEIWEPVRYELENFGDWALNSDGFGVSLTCLTWLTLGVVIGANLF